MNPVETYLKELRDIRGTGSAVDELSYYTALANLLNEIGRTLKPKVRCVVNPANRGAGLPDIGLFTADQIKKNDPNPMKGQPPARGVVEAKGLAEDVQKVARKEQVKDYVAGYGVVLVTNFRDFLLLGRDAQGNPLPKERYTLAGDEAAFWQAAAHPQKTAAEQGEQVCEYLKRVLLSVAPLSAPQDVAWFLASYARTAKGRVESHKDLSALAAVREALEEALGMKFTGEKGEHFFRSTLVQTIFYGVFSAWVLWHRERPEREEAFDWRVSAFSLRVPFIRALYDEVATPTKLGDLGLVEVLDWTAGTLNRVDRAAFFLRFQDEHAVQYFYEPFLQAFDPELRKELGVWYTPPEIVQYQVARVDTVLREELGLADGLADPNVVVLDPCCGTGAYLVEVLKKIAETLKAKGGDALIASDLKRAAMTRVFGFEILPAPYVVSHLQLGLRLQDLGVPLDEDERVGVYLTNSLTGWEPPKEPKQTVLEFMRELQQEKDAAEKVKRETPLLVILGNPPYNGYAGVAFEEERGLSTAYRTTKRAPKPQGQGLNDLYVRFYRMAERHVVEKQGRGVVCYISNYSWLDGLSFTGMRERYMEEFDRIWIDCLNGDKYKTGKLTPSGDPDPSIFSTEFNREGIQVGTAIALLVRKQDHQQTDTVRFRHLWGKRKREELLETADNDGKTPYEELTPPVEIGYPFLPAQVEDAYLSWPRLPDLFPVSFPGVKTSRDDLVVDIDRERLIERMKKYFDPAISHEEMRAICPKAMESTARFGAEAVRERLQERGFSPESVVRYCYRPFDMRWLYWEAETKLLDEKRADYFPRVREGNVWLTACQRNRKDKFYQPQITTCLADHHVVESNVAMFPLRLTVPRTQGRQVPLIEPQKVGMKELELNVSHEAWTYAGRKGTRSAPEDAKTLFFHVVAILHSPTYREQNAGALRQNWPRVPLPVAGEFLRSSAALGERLMALLNPEEHVPGITSGKLEPIFRSMGVLLKIGQTTAGGGCATQLDPDAGDLAVTAGWGHAGKGGVTMPGKGRILQRPYDKAELEAIASTAKAQGLSQKQALALLGPNTRDVYLNDKAYWKNIPANVWEYYIGGYQVIKKWLSYREQELLGRALRSEEAREVTGMARRLAAIVLLQPALDENYRRAKADAFPWANMAQGPANE